MYLKNINLKRLKQLVSPLLILLVLVLPVAVVSCEDMMGNYLEKPPGGDVTEDTIFSSRTQVETFLIWGMLRRTRMFIPIGTRTFSPELATRPRRVPTGIA